VGQTAAGYPSRPVTLIVPFSPGTGIDILARTIGPRLSQRWGQPVVVDNKPGASGNIGADVVAKAQPNGYTLMVTVNTLTITPSLYKNVPYDVVSDFAPISKIALATYCFAVNPTVLPANNLAEAIAADMPTLGICLGSQLIAAVAGAEVAPGPVAEIGWYRITPAPSAATDPLFGETAPFAGLEWHRDAFPLPPAAIALASSANYPVQAFRLGRHVYGLLFHLEVDPPMVDAWREVFASGVALPPGDIAPDFAGANRRAVRLAHRLFLGD
jgi:hypothetical protein